MIVAYAYFLPLIILSYWFAGGAESSMYVKYGEFFFHVIPKHH